MLLLLAAILAGVLLPVQAGLNASLRGILGSPFAASLVNFLVGTAGLVVVSILTRAAIPSRAALAATTPWMWLGGLLGATFVASSTVLAPRLGAATLTATVVLGQMTASLLLDHYGMLGFPQHGLTAGRLLGAALVLAGVLLIQRA